MAKLGGEPTLGIRKSFTRPKRLAIRKKTTDNSYYRQLCIDESSIYIIRKSCRNNGSLHCHCTIAASGNSFYKAFHFELKKLRHYVAYRNIQFNYNLIYL